ncbi:hypothetical protein ABXT08_20835 [Chryseobacterium sp. NRRL B-14859]|uniref:hypothetical protein n=1 Tax=Chryseobacterium sp. NRRL B-14859 TaxID=1562763 RepID=UPI0033920ACB
MNITKRYLLVMLIGLLCFSCKKVFSENMESFTFQLKGDVYLDKSTKSILFMYKIGGDSYTLGKVIVDHIDSVYISKDKSIVYIINNKNEYLKVNPDSKIEKLNNRPDVNFASIYGL